MERIYENARNLRKNMTKEECRLWYDFLRNYPLRFMRQRPIDQYIADFYCAGAKLVIEIDGGQHFEDDRKQYDKERDRVLSAYGIKTLRIPNTEIMKNFPAVCEYIDRIVHDRMVQGLPFEKGAVGEAD